MKKPVWIIAALCCFVLAAFFAFALIGYLFTALLFAGIGVLITVFHFLEYFQLKKLRIALIILLCIGLVIFTAAEIPVVKAAKGDGDISCDYMIVLGAGVNGTVPSLSLVNRLTAALDYLEKHPETIAIVSGGQGSGEDISEAQAMQTWLVGKGIEPERIVMEDKATSTMENLSFSADIIRQREGSISGKVAIVSSEYHLYRAKEMARQLGIEALGIPGRTSYPVLKMNYFIREAFAVIYMKVFGI